MRGMGERRPPLPTAIARTLGFEVMESEPGRAMVEVDADPERHGNQQGTVHGGFIVELLDAAMGTAHEAVIPLGASFATIEIKVNFLRPVWKARLRAEVWRAHAGRTLSLYEGRVLRPDGKLVASATSTVMTLTGASAEGRVPARNPRRGEET
jgi:uncharacterized protein (TIGR00369 family)